MDSNLFLLSPVSPVLLSENESQRAMLKDVSIHKKHLKGKKCSARHSSCLCVIS